MGPCVVICVRQAQPGPQQSPGEHKIWILSPEVRSQFGRHSGEVQGPSMLQKQLWSTGTCSLLCAVPNRQGRASCVASGPSGMDFLLAGLADAREPQVLCSVLFLAICRWC